MADNDRTTCPSHGEAITTFMCQHLVDGTAKEYICADPDPGNVLSPDNPEVFWPNAWCEICEAARMRYGGQSGAWTDDSVAIAGIRAICHHCYNAIREKLSPRPPSEIVERFEIKREPGFLYYLRGCDVWRRSSRELGSLVDGPEEQIATGHFQREDAYLYFLDNQGNARRAKREVQTASQKG